MGRGSVFSPKAFACCACLVSSSLSAENKKSGNCLVTCGPGLELVCLGKGRFLSLCHFTPPQFTRVQPRRRLQVTTWALSSSFHFSIAERNRYFLLDCTQYLANEPFALSLSRYLFLRLFEAVEYSHLHLIPTGLIDDMYLLTQRP